MLPAYLTGERQLQGLQVHGPAVYVARPIPTRGFLGIKRNPRIAAWLERHFGLSPDQVVRILDTYGVLAGTRIGLLSWCTRSLIALEGALLSPANIIVFDTFGLDAGTIQPMYGLVQARPNNSAFIHISTTLEAERLCPPGARCLRVEISTHPTRVPA